MYSPPVSIVGVYRIGDNTSYPHVHQLLLHANTVLQAYEYLERNVLDERDTVYLYIVDLRIKLDRLFLLAPYDGM